MKRNKFAILSGSCKVVDGYSRSIVIDYSRNNLYFITHQYSNLLKLLNRNKISSILNELEDHESIEYFNDFLRFLMENELIFLVDDATLFPEKSDFDFEEHTILQDVIIEMDQSHYSRNIFMRVINDLKLTKCEDFQLRMLSDFNFDFLNEILDIINDTSCNYLEIHCTYNDYTNNETLHGFVEENVLISKIFVYNSPKVDKYVVINDVGEMNTIALGEIWYLDYPFDNGNSCGLINFENLSFIDTYSHNRLKSKNGCLYKKLTIDIHGNIKNCPSIKKNFGNIEKDSILEILKSPQFTELWYVHKDQIETCKICEFRYNCTDCRAFISNREDIYSKPSKCNYNPITCEWEN